MNIQNTINESKGNIADIVMAALTWPRCDDFCFSASTPVEEIQKVANEREWSESDFRTMSISDLLMDTRLPPVIDEKKDTVKASRNIDLLRAVIEGMIYESKTEIDILMDAYIDHYQSVPISEIVLGEKAKGVDPATRAQRWGEQADKLTEMDVAGMTIDIWHRPVSEGEISLEHYAAGLRTNGRYIGFFTVQTMVITDSNIEDPYFDDEIRNISNDISSFLVDIQNRAGGVPDERFALLGIEMLEPAFRGRGIASKVKRALFAYIGKRHPDIAFLVAEFHPIQYRRPFSLAYPEFLVFEYMQTCQKMYQHFVDGKFEDAFGLDKVTFLPFESNLKRDRFALTPFGID